MKVTTMTKEPMKVMTTKNHANTKRDKHPARNARVLTTGISLASIFGLTSTYALAARPNPPVSGNEPIASAPGVAESVTPSASDVAIAPTQPAPAIPTVQAVVNTPTRTPPVSVAQTKSTPSVAAQPAPAPVTVVILPPNPTATRSSGSK